MIFALAGNQNCGKTTLFNNLTGANQHVGNFPGVTVERKMGEIRAARGNSVVDLPGIYSLRPYSGEEAVALDFLLNEKPDGIINIVDATNIERNLYLTLQLLELDMPMVLALNMMDELRANGGSVDVAVMSKRLGIPVVAISAVKNEGVAELVKRSVDTAQQKLRPSVKDFCPEGPVHRCIHAVSLLVEDHAARAGLPSRYAATRLIEDEPGMADKLGINQNERELIEHAVLEMENETGLDRNAAIADMRYTFIEKVCDEAVKKGGESGGRAAASPSTGC
jgi:ferrous iron transport protein B